MKFENTILTKKNLMMMRLLGILMFCLVFQGVIFAEETNGFYCTKERCCPGSVGPQGVPGAIGDPGPDFGQFACLYNSVRPVLTTGENVLFQNQISLSGITYDSSTGIFTLQPGTYSVTYFSNPSGNFNLVANGGIVPNAPLGGSATILTLSNGTNTLVLQAQSDVDLPAAPANQCNAMITIYQIN